LGVVEDCGGMVVAGRLEDYPWWCGAGRGRILLIVDENILTFHSKS
jgi:hypothetical protein